MIYVGKRLNAPNGAFIGIVLGAIHVRDYFEDLYAICARCTAKAARWRSGATTAPCSRAPTEADAAIDAAPPLDLSRPMPSNGLLSYWAADAHGATIAVAQRRLDDLPLVIEVRQSASAMLAPWNSEFLATGFGGGALLLLVGIAVWLLMRQLQTQALIIEERARANHEAEAREEIERGTDQGRNRDARCAAERGALPRYRRSRQRLDLGNRRAASFHPGRRRANSQKVSLLGKTRWEARTGCIDPESDPVWMARARSRSRRASALPPVPFLHQAAGRAASMSASTASPSSPRMAASSAIAAPSATKPS